MTQIFYQIKSDTTKVLNESTATVLSKCCDFTFNHQRESCGNSSQNSHVHFLFYFLQNT